MKQIKTFSKTVPRLSFPVEVPSEDSSVTSQHADERVEMISVKVVSQKNALELLIICTVEND